MHDSTPRLFFARHSLLTTSYVVLILDTTIRYNIYILHETNLTDILFTTKSNRKIWRLFSATSTHEKHSTSSANSSKTAISLAHGSLLTEAIITWTECFPHVYPNSLINTQYGWDECFFAAAYITTLFRTNPHTTRGDALRVLVRVIYLLWWHKSTAV